MGRISIKTILFHYNIYIVIVAYFSLSVKMILVI